MLNRLYVGRTRKERLGWPTHDGCTTALDVWNVFMSEEEDAEAVLQVSAGDVDEVCATDLASKMPRQDARDFGAYALALLTPYRIDPLHLRVEGQLVRVPAGSYVVVNPQESAAPEPGHPFSATMITLFQTILRDTREAVGVSKSAGPFDFARTVRKLTPTLQATVKGMVAHAQSVTRPDDAPWVPLQMYLEGVRLLAALWKDHPSQLKDRMAQRGYHASGDARLDRALEYMRVHVTEACGNSTIAQVAGLSPPHFYRMFQRAMGCTPREYLRRLRVAQAERLLKRAPKGKSALADIAKAVGLGSGQSLKRAYLAVRGQALEE